MIEFHAGDVVMITTGSLKTHNLRTLRGTVTGWTLRPIEGTDHAFRLFTVETIEGTVTEAASRIVLIHSAPDGAASIEAPEPVAPVTAGMIRPGDTVTGSIWCRKGGREYTREATVTVDRAPWYAGRNMILPTGRGVVAVLRDSVSIVTRAGSDTPAPLSDPLSF